MVEDYVGELAAGIDATVETEGNVTTITLSGTDIKPGIPERLNELFAVDTILQEEDLKTLTAIVLVDAIPIGKSTIVQENEALALYPDDEDIQDNVKTKSYTIAGSPDEYAILLLEGEQTVKVTVTPEVEALKTEYIIKSNLTFAKD